MKGAEQENAIINRDDMILVTGAAGFIGQKVVTNLLRRGFCNIRCLVRPSTSPLGAETLHSIGHNALEIIEGNLLSHDDCVRAATGARVLIHLAAGRGEKSFPDAFLNSVVTTRNLLDACMRNQFLRRFVNMSSFAVYANDGRNRGGILDETAATLEKPEMRGEAYCFAKTWQDAIASEYRNLHGLPLVTVRPGWVYGPGNTAITGRVGIGTFGIFLHLGGSNQVPLTYVDNCADAIVLAALIPGVDGEIFNVVDDNLPTSRSLLRAYKRRVRRFPSLYLPKAVSYGLCYLWEKYSERSRGQLPLAFTRARWNCYWRKTRYSNDKLKARLKWVPAVSTCEGLGRYFDACAAKEMHG